MENMIEESKSHLTEGSEELPMAPSTGDFTVEDGIPYSQSYLKELEHQSALRLAASRSWAEGWAIGIAEVRREVATKLISLGFQDEIVMYVTCLSAGELDELRKSCNNM